MKAVVTVHIFSIIVAFILYYTSPMRLTRVLVTAMAGAERVYFEALEMGVLSVSNVHATEIVLATLQLKVSRIRQETLSNSRSNWKTCCEYFEGRTLIVLRCIWEVRDFETHIEILKEAQLCENNLDPPMTRAISIRRRCVVHGGGERSMWCK